MFKYYCIIIFLCFGQQTRANEIWIRYHLPQAHNVTMIWGINDWKAIEKMPVGTQIKDKVMHSPMAKEGEDFVLKLELPDSCTIDYIFEYTKV